MLALQLFEPEKLAEVRYEDILVSKPKKNVLKS